MFFPTKMCKVRVIERKTSLRKIIEALEKFGGAEIKKVEHKELLPSKPMETLPETSEKLVKAEAIISALTPQKNGARMSRKDAADFLRSNEARKTMERVMAINAEKEKITAETEVLKEEKKKITDFEGFEFNFPGIGFQTIDVAAGIVQNRNTPIIEKMLGDKRVLRQARKPHRLKAQLYFMVLRKGSEGFLQELAKNGFEGVQLPNIEGTPAKEMQGMEKRVEQLEKNKEELARELEKISKQHYSNFAAAIENLRIEAEKQSAPAKFGTTNHTVIVEAYLPEKNYFEFEAFVKQELGESVFIQKFGSREMEESHEEAPTLLEHNNVLAPFEFITRYMSLPKSNEVDPTILFLIFFPLFYAMMVGDFVYGIISFLVARLLMQRFPPESILNPVAKIWMWSAIPTIIFGVIFDEYMGMSHTELFEKLGFGHVQVYHGIERLHNIQFLLVASILMGVFVMALGFLLGFLNAMKHNDKKHALAKLAWFGVVVFGSTTIATGMFKALPEFVLLPSGALLIASLLAVIKLEGIVGVIELPSVAGNVLSFARILAVGLVGTVIAKILNDMAFPGIDKGFLLVVLIPLYVLGHLFNVVMAMFESFIQGARLNYVEFYSKFFEGGGREFTPFRFTRKYLKD